MYFTFPTSHANLQVLSSGAAVPTFLGATIHREVAVEMAKEFSRMAIHGHTCHIDYVADGIGRHRSTWHEGKPFNRDAPRAPIPAPPPGALPDCGDEWLKAQGLPHNGMPIDN
jgi:hypothetical protein